MVFSNQKLLSIARPVRYAAGARLVRQGEASRGAFLIASGRLEAEVALPGGGTLAGKLRALNARVREHPAAEDRPACDLPPSVKTDYSRTPEFPWRAFLPVLRFFEGFDDYEIEELVAPARAFALERGAWLFAAGQSADACFLVVRGALEIISSKNRVERRVALAGPGELVGYLAVLDGAPHTASARVRESVCLLALPAAEFLRLYRGDSGAAVSLLHAIHASLLRALSRTNNQLTRLISAARLRGAHEEGRALEAARGSQIIEGSTT